MRMELQYFGGRGAASGSKSTKSSRRNDRKRADRKREAASNLAGALTRLIASRRSSGNHGSEQLSLFSGI